MILVTGAGGKTGQAVVCALARRGAAVRGLVRRAEQVAALEGLGAREAVVGDMRRPADWAVALRGVQSIYHICPNMDPDEEAIGGMALAAARRAEVRHFVYHSVLHPQTEAMPHHWHKLRVEECILESGLAFTVLQPAAYMQNVLAGWEMIVAQGAYRVPYGTQTRLGMVDLLDVAEVAATVLTETGYMGAMYELAGPDVLSQDAVAALLGAGLGRPVAVQVMSLSDWERQAREGGLGEYQIQTLLAMFHYYDRYGFWGNPRVLGWLLGRAPTSFAAFVDRVSR